MYTHVHTSSFFVIPSSSRVLLASCSVFFRERLMEPTENRAVLTTFVDSSENCVCVRERESIHTCMCTGGKYSTLVLPLTWLHLALPSSHCQ